MVRATASGAVDLGLISSRVKPTTFKLVFTAFLLDAVGIKGTVWRTRKQAGSSIVVPLGKTLGGIPPSWCGRLKAGNS